MLNNLQKVIFCPAQLGACIFRKKELPQQIRTCYRSMSKDFRVLTIQSHVVSGYAGNKSAVFPLQVLGFEVDFINTVHFSNHTGYKVWKGTLLSEDDFEDILDGLRSNGLLNITHVLTGYCRSAGILTRIGRLVKELKAINPSLEYVCDPVMGDNGKMYVPPEVLPIYRDILLPLADVICPNQFEAEQLTEKSISSIEELLEVVDILHQRGSKTVCVSSSELGTDDHLLGMASTIVEGKRKAVSVIIPKYKFNFTGTGDLFAALMLAWTAKTKHNVQLSLENTIATLQAVLERTVSSCPADDKPKELRLIQSKHDIENPVIKIKAQPL